MYGRTSSRSDALRKSHNPAQENHHIRGKSTMARTFE
jgi:hypothetical protein